MASNDQSSGSPLLGGIEAGGTKFVCALGRGPRSLVCERRLPTTSPDATVRAVAAFFKEAQAEHGEMAAIGIGSFGPVDVTDPGSRGFGTITTTPKDGWRHFPLLQKIREGIGREIPAGFDTDVNAAALGESRWGAGEGLDSLIYLTVGTGIGGGALVNGELVHGLQHPETGHLRVPHDRSRDPFEGSCPFHGDCLEGLASGPAIEQRWGKKAEDLPRDHAAWRLEADYLAAAIMNMTLVISPMKIILGGGVMKQEQLYPLVRERFEELRGGYIEHPCFGEGIAEYIVPPGLGDKSGILGALALADRSLKEAAKACE